MILGFFRIRTRAGWSREPVPRGRSREPVLQILNRLRIPGFHNFGQIWLSPRKKLRNGKNSISRIMSQNTFWNIMNRLQSKNSTKHFWLSHFLLFWPKTTKSQEKCSNEKNFRFRGFRFETRFETFWIDSD